MNVIEQLKNHEGEKLKVYKCTSGKETIGVGRNLVDRGITKEESNYLLANDVRFFSGELREKLWYFDNLNEARQAVLINMAFNLGVSGLLKFRMTLSYIENQYYEQASVEMMDSTWAVQVGNRAYELSEQMKTGYFK